MAYSKARRKLTNIEEIQVSKMLLDKMHFNIPANPEDVQFQKKIFLP